MPRVTLSGATFAKAKAAAEPLVDDADSVISRALDLLLKEKRGRVPTEPAPRGEVIRLEIGTKALTHTRLTSVNLDGAALSLTEWNALARELHVLARSRLGSFDAVRSASTANLRRGRFEDNGYRYLPEVDFSIQGADANNACESAFKLAVAMRIPLKVMFEWRDNEDAAYPGRSGVIEWSPIDTPRPAITDEQRRAAMDRWRSI